jgi:hypothetical protein
MCLTTLNKYNAAITTSAGCKFLFISSRDKPGSIQELKTSLGNFQFAYFLDSTRSVSNRLSIDVYPTMVEYRPDKNQYFIYKGTDKIDLLFNSLK